MLKRILVISFVLVATLVAFTSCTKVKDNLYRTWKLETMLASDVSVTWDFKDNGTLIRVYNGGERVDTASFSVVKQNLVFEEIEIKGAVDFPNFAAPNGAFKVDKISDKKLVITRYEHEDGKEAGSYLRREFIAAD